MRPLLPPPAPGLYRDIPPETYHAWDCASRSTLSRLVDTRSYTPEDVRWGMEHDQPDTDALALGTALHCALLEPLDYGERVALGPVNPKSGRTYGRETKAWTDQAGERPGLTLLTTEQMETLPHLVAAIQAHPEAAQILSLTTDRELTCVATLDLPKLHYEYGLPWDGGDEDAELLVKGRLDGLCATIRLIWDLKSTAAATEWELRKAYTDYGYAHQAALYPLLAQAVGLEVEHFALLAVRTQKPRRAAVLRATDRSVRIAWRDLLPAMHTMARCYRTDTWPAWPPGIIDMELAEWKLREAGY